MTPAPTGIDALLTELEALRAMHNAAEHYEHWNAYKLALVKAFPELAAALRSQSQELAEREEAIRRLRALLLEGANLPQHMPSTELLGWSRRVREALASAPKGEPETPSRCAHIHDDDGAYGVRCEGPVVANGYCRYHQFLVRSSVPKEKP